MEVAFLASNEYDGRYVAMKSFDDRTVVGVGDDPETALKEALENGHDDPVIVYVPEKDMVHIY